MALTDVKIKNLKAKDRPYKVADKNNLYVQVSPAGGKLWRLKYSFCGKRKVMALGKYPIISLSEARQKMLDAKKLLTDGIDPAVERQKKQADNVNTFQKVSAEWWQAKKATWSQGHAALIWRRLEKNILPWLGNRSVADITTRELLEVLRKIEARGAIETARRICQVCGQIFMYGVACGYCENNIASGLVTALKQRKTRHFAAITETDKVKGLLRDIDAVEGSFVVSCALKITPLVFVRPGELRKAEWQEIDLEAALWTIPSEKMKMKRPHLVPLSSQAVEIFKDIYPLTGHGLYVFPSIRTDKRPMSENTLNVALRRLGYSKDEMTAHGFRTTASTLLHEMGWKSEVIETQLAHRDRNKIRGIYNKAQYLDERRDMMQAWADYLGGLKADAKVIAINKAANNK